MRHSATLETRILATALKLPALALKADTFIVPRLWGLGSQIAPPLPNSFVLNLVVDATIVGWRLHLNSLGPAEDKLKLGSEIALLLALVVLSGLVATGLLALLFLK